MLDTEKNVGCLSLVSFYGRGVMLFGKCLGTHKKIACNLMVNTKHTLVRI